MEWNGLECVPHPLFTHFYEICAKIEMHSDIVHNRAADSLNAYRFAYIFVVLPIGIQIHFQDYRERIMRTHTHKRRTTRQWASK